MKLLSQRGAKLGVAGALALASLAGGTGLAEAAPASATASGTVVAHVQATAPDVGVPPEGLAPNALVTTPDGSKTRATDPGAFGQRRGGDRNLAAAGADKSVSISADFHYAFLNVTGARIRASVPNGKVLALATGNGIAGCKIPASDGYLWGWVNFQRAGGHDRVSGWMRSDLFRVWYGTFSADARYLPWC